MSHDFLMTLGCPWRQQKGHCGYWALRIFDTCGMTDRPCCDSMGIGCLCQWCWALLKYHEAKNRMEWYASVLERLKDEKEADEEEERRGDMPRWRRRRW